MKHIASKTNNNINIFQKYLYWAFCNFLADRKLVLEERGGHK